MEAARWDYNHHHVYKCLKPAPEGTTGVAGGGSDSTKDAVLQQALAAGRTQAEE